MKSTRFMENILRRFLPLLLFGFSSQLFAQMEITDATTPPITPANLITNIFLGDGVEVLDVTFSGDPLAIGYFKNALNEVGIERGILMTSGRAASANCTGGPLGADCNGTQFSSNDNTSTVSDPDLSAIASGTIHDAAKFSITFIPTSDTLRFKYVFASEEYPEYACTRFNDAFGFFISGPGINGPYQNNGINIAQIPGTALPVSINNIHPDNPPGCPPSFDQYYNDNMNNNSQPVYDGYLSVFIAQAVVIPCETYTIKLMVSDVGDGIYDTGVFLEAKSFGTGLLNVETSTVSLDGTITEGCSSGTMTFSFSDPVESDYPLDYTIIGTAINGVDYDSIPPGLTIPAGDSTISVDIIAIVDSLAEGMETIGVDIQRDVCNRDTFWIFIRDNEILPPDLGPDTTICHGDSVALDGALPVPLPVPPQFTNDQDYLVDHNGPTYSPILVAGVQPVTLGPGVIRSVCVNILHKWVDDLDLFLISPGGQFIELSSDNGSNCDNYNQVCFTPTAGTAIDFGWPWSPCPSTVEASFSGGSYQPEGVWEDLWDGDYPTNGTWQLLALDDAQGFNGTILDWTITFEPLYQLYYSWEPEAGLNCADCPGPMASPDTTTTYTLTAWDTYGCAVYDTVTINVLDVLPAPDVTCNNITDQSITFDWGQVPGSMGYQVSVNGAGWTVPNNGPLSHVVNGLTLSDTVTIQVFAIGQCDGEIGTAICNTPPCDPPAAVITGQTNIACNGGTEGAVTIAASGGAGGYTFQLDSIFNTTGVFTGLPGGDYTIIVKDAWNCPNFVFVTISEPDSLALQDVVLNQISCNGGADGSATVAITGGMPPYQFDWNNGSQTDSIATNLGLGTQTISVIDANGCMTATTTDITEPELLTLNTATDSATCFGTNTGAALVLIGGGTAPYTIQWDAAAGNATTALVNDLAAGTYSVEVTDFNDCIATATATVEEPSQVLTATNSTALLCNDSGDGTATVFASGGTPSYTYLWSNGATAASSPGLDAGLQLVTVTDFNGCAVVDSVNVDAPPAIQIVLSPADALCFGTNSGAVVSQITGGTEPYAYVWNGVTGGPDLTGVPAGNYCLMATDANGCTATVCTDVGQPDALGLSANLTDAGCDGESNGAIDLTVLGGTPPFSYNWANGDTMEDLTGLPAGTYAVVVSDANGCSASLTETLTDIDAIVLSVSGNDVNCFGGSDGTIDLQAAGGTGVFSFAWSGPNGYSSAVEDPANVPAGDFNVVVTDNAGCQATTGITLSQPASALEVSISPPANICFDANDGTTTASAIGGTPPYQYNWSSGHSAPTATGLSAGIFQITVTDARGCQDMKQVEIVQQGPLTLTLEQSAATCNNGSNGSATVASVFEGANPVPLSDLSIIWDWQAQTTPTATNLTAGETYHVTITNNLGCTATAGITIGNPAPVEVNILTSEDVKCAGGSDGSATVSGTGGTLPYNYLWSINAGGQTTATAIGLPSGTFTVTITDAGGCTATANLSLDEPSAIQVSFSNKKVQCFGGSDGSATAFPEGGTSPYNLSWSNGQTGAQATNLPPGMVTLTVTDANGCERSDSTEILQPEAPVSADFDANDVSCFGFKDGQIQVLPGGGSPPYVYSLDGENYYGSSTIIALETGVYHLFVKDKNGCLFDFDGIVIGEPEQLLVDLGPDTTTYYGAHINIHPILIGVDSADWDMLTFQWFSNNPQNPVNYPNWRVGDFVVYSPTTATLTVTDQNGCTAGDLINIFVREYRSIEVPTGFTPGGDGVNDLLHVHGSSYLVEKITFLRIFDRWGELLYENGGFDINDTSIGWDGAFRGQDMPAGVYVWHMEVKFIDGSSETYKGHTTLIR
jgi:gliding motility-associated-like protein